MLACVCTDWLSSISKQLGIIFPLICFKPYRIFFPFVVFYSWLDPVIIFDLFPGCILLVTFNWSHHFGVQKKQTCLNTNVDFFFSPCLSFLFWMNVTVVHQALYIFIVLPFPMSVNCLDHFVSVTSWSLMCGCLYRLHVCLKSFIYLRNVLLFTPYHLNVKKPASLLVWGCAGSVLWWETVLWSACPLNIACERKRDVWTITFGGGKRPGLPDLTLFCEIADTWNVSRQLLQN